MKRAMLFAMIAIGAMAVNAQATTKPVTQNAKAKKVLTPEEVRKRYMAMTPEQRAERRRRFMEAKLRHTGGRIVKPDSMKGSIVFYNAQKSFNPTNITGVINEIRADMAYNITTENLDAVPSKKGVAKFLKDKNVNFAIFLIDDKEDPTTLSIYPEQRYAVVNAVAVGGKDIRFRRELKRTFGFLCGTCASTYPCSLMSPVLAPIDIDTFVNDRYSVDLIQRMSIYLGGYEVTPQIVTTYRKAVEEGWAPAPTNKYQQAAWDDVRAVPTSPIKIKP